MTEPPFISPPRPSALRAHPFVSALIALLIAASIGVTLIVPVYNRLTPKVGGFPFFYFYLLACTPFVAIALGIVIQLQKRLSADSTDAGGQTP